jgi:hypothetical protein
MFPFEGGRWFIVNWSLYTYYLWFRAIRAVVVDLFVKREIASAGFDMRNSDLLEVPGLEKAIWRSSNGCRCRRVRGCIGFTRTSSCSFSHLERLSEISLINLGEYSLNRTPAGQ